MIPHQIGIENLKEVCHGDSKIDASGNEIKASKTRTVRGMICNQVGEKQATGVIKDIVYPPVFSISKRLEA